MKATRLGLPIMLGMTGLLFWLAYGYFALLDMPHFLVNAPAQGLYLALFILYGYLTMTIGVFLGSAYRELKKRRAAGRVSVKIGELTAFVLRTVDFWLGMFASPVVYVIVLQAVDLENFTVSGMIGITLVGLQNGFVCNTIADGLIQGQMPPSTNPSQVDPKVAGTTSN